MNNTTIKNRQLDQSLFYCGEPVASRSELGQSVNGALVPYTDAQRALLAQSRPNQLRYVIADRVLYCLDGHPESKSAVWRQVQTANASPADPEMGQGVPVNQVMVVDFTQAAEQSIALSLASYNPCASLIASFFNDNRYVFPGSWGEFYYTPPPNVGKGIASVTVNGVFIPMAVPEIAPLSSVNPTCQAAWYAKDYVEDAGVVIAFERPGPTGINTGDYSLLLNVGDIVSIIGYYVNN